MVIIVLVVIRLHSLFAVVMLTGIFSLCSAGLFTVMDAVDVAFTEAAVGAGISTILMLAALSLTVQREKTTPQRSLLPLMVVLGTGALLIYGTLDMAPYGDPSATIHSHVAPHYIVESLKEIQVPNMVTSILASYRGFDTLGETVVIFTAGIGVLLLLSGRGSVTVRDRDEEDA